MTRAHLYVTETELAGRLGVKADEWPEMAAVLERKGLPPRNPLFKNRRYWPAVAAFFDRYEGLRETGAVARDGVENWNGPKQNARRRPAHA